MAGIETISYIKIGNQTHPIDAVTVNGLSFTSNDKTRWDNKQDTLTFDSIPTENSNNLVKSGDLYTVIIDNEEITAAALNDLNDRLYDMEQVGFITYESDPVFSSSVAASISASDITNWNSKTSNTGTLTGVKFNGTSASISNGIASISVSLPPTITEATVSGWGFTKNAAPGKLTTTATTALSTATNEALSGNISLHKIAKTGTYSDLVGKPDLPVAAYFNPANKTAYFFKSTADRDSFIADKTQTSLAMFSTEVSEYIEFVDPNIKSVCVSTYGDGTGVTYARAKRSLSLNNVFKDNTNISVFDEFTYFTGTNAMYSAFENSSLRKITFPKGLKWSNNGSAWALIFKNCTQLKEINFADFTRQSAALNGQFQNFTGCSALTTLHFESIEQINNLVPTNYYQSDTPFGYNSGTHYVYIKDELYEDKLLTNLVIPDTITAIRTAAFYRFNCITSLTIPSTVSSIGAYAFYQCTGITNASLTIPSSVTSIGASAFQNCSGLTGDLVVPSSVTSIGLNAFNNCKTLNSLTIKSTSQIPTGAITAAAQNGTVHVYGNVKATNGYQYLSSRHIIIDGNYEGYNTQDVQVQYVESVRIGGNYTHLQGQSFTNYSNSSIFCFFELMGTATNAIISNTGWVWKNQSGGIIHLGYNGIACTPGQLSAQNTAIAKIYVGPGESQAGDQAILDMYLADSSWATYSSKLDLWYNYTGTYKTS